MQEQKSFKPREVIIQEGKPGDGFWILESGTVEVVKGTKVVAELHDKGTIFGELSDLLKEPCTSTVRAKTDCTATHVFKSIDMLVNESPAIAKKVIYTLARRLSNTTNKLQNLLPETDTISLDHELEILVVDDKQSMVKAIQSSLSSRPWKVSCEPQTGVALEKIQVNEYALVVLSLNLPNDSAFEFFRQLKKNPVTRNTTVLASASTTEQGMSLRRRAKDSGMDHFLEKQATPREIEASIMVALRLDPSTLYFTIRSDVLVGTLPIDCTDFDKVEMVHTSVHAIENAVASRVKKAVLDVHHLITPHESWRAPIEKMMKAFKRARMKCAIYGNQDIIELMGEENPYDIFSSEQDALASLEEPESDHLKQVRQESLTSAEDIASQSQAKPEATSEAKASPEADTDDDSSDDSSDDAEEPETAATN